MNRLREVFNETEITAIGVEAMETMKRLGPDSYYQAMVYGDEWFAICLRAVPEKEEALIDWIAQADDVPGDQIRRLIYDAERVVFGVTIAEFRSDMRPQDLQFSGFVCIRMAMLRADHTMGRNVEGFDD